MALINDHYLKLTAGYLFPEIGRRVAKFCDANPTADVIKLGIGDVTEPLPPAIVAAMHAAVDEMGQRESFRGYGPEQGYEFLREAIVENAYRPRGVNLSADEIFISDGSKCDSGNILDVYRNASYPKISGGVRDYNREHTSPKSYGFPDHTSHHYRRTDYSWRTN